VIVHRDHRRRLGLEVEIKMTLDEFRETVEWLEGVDPHDGATKDWRLWLDSIDPPSVEEAA
jgi:hypothetical protein